MEHPQKLTVIDRNEPLPIGPDAPDLVCLLKLPEVEWMGHIIRLNRPALPQPAERLRMGGAVDGGGRFRCWLTWPSALNWQQQPPEAIRNSCNDPDATDAVPQRFILPACGLDRRSLRCVPDIWACRG